MELKEIHYYDSMSGDGRLYLKAAMQWLRDESLNKRGLTLNATNEWRLIQKEAHVPQQHNGNDCGVFVIMCTRAIAYDQSFTTYHQSDMPRYRKMVGRHIIHGSLQEQEDGSFPYFFALPPRQQQLSSPEFAFESPPQQRQSSGAFSKTCIDISSVHTTLLLSPPKKRQRKSINTTFSPNVVVQPSQSPVHLALLHHYNEKSIVDSSEDSGEEESNGDDYDNGEGRNVGNTDNNDSEDSEDSSGVVEKNPPPTTISLQQIPMQDRTDFSNVVRKKTKRVYRRGLSEEEKEAFRQQSRIKDRDRKRAERAALSEEKKKTIRLQDCQRKKDAASKTSAEDRAATKRKDRDRKRAERAAISEEKKETIREQDYQHKKDAASKMSAEDKAATNRRRKKSRCEKKSMRVEVPAGRQADIDGYTEIPCSYTHK